MLNAIGRKGKYLVLLIFLCISSCKLFKKKVIEIGPTVESLQYKISKDSLEQLLDLQKSKCEASEEQLRNLEIQRILSDSLLAMSQKQQLLNRDKISRLNEQLSELELSNLSGDATLFAKGILTLHAGKTIESKEYFELILQRNNDSAAVSSSTLYLDTIRTIDSSAHYVALAKENSTVEGRIENYEKALKFIPSDAISLELAKQLILVDTIAALKALQEIKNYAPALAFSKMVNPFVTVNGAPIKLKCCNGSIVELEAYGSCGGIANVCDTVYRQVKMKKFNFE